MQITMQIKPFMGLLMLVVYADCTNTIRMDVIFSKLVTLFQQKFEDDDKFLLVVIILLYLELNKYMR